MPIIFWCHTVLFFKAFDEIGNVIKTGLMGDLSNRYLSCFQQGSRVIQTIALDVGEGCLMKVFLEKADEVVVAVIGNGC